MISSPASNKRKNKKNKQKNKKKPIVEEQAVETVQPLAQDVVPEADLSFNLCINLPNDLGKMELIVPPQITIVDVVQLILESAESQFYTCFHLEFNGVELAENMELGDIPDFTPESAIDLVPGVYNDREVRTHLMRFRELVTNLGISRKSYGYECSKSMFSCVNDGEDVDENLNNLTDLFEIKEESVEKCIKSLGIAAWNPPPFSRKMAGDIMYLVVETLEGQEVFVTCGSTGFWVGNSTKDKFDPLAATNSCHSHTLPGLLSLLSSSFAEKFPQLQQQVFGKRHPYELLAVSPANALYPWCVTTGEHENDPGRLLDVQIESLEITDTLTSRDWNEELQNLRELPQSSTAEKLIKEQTLHKQHSDFVTAAVKGVDAIVSKSLMPLNHLEPEENHLYIHNNIFFSQGYDNREQFEHLGGAEATHVSFSKDIDGVSSLNRHELEGVFTLGSCMVDYMGRRIVSQTIVPGILKKTSNAENENILQFGSIDGGKTIAVEDSFKEAIEKVSNALHLDNHIVTDASGKKHEISLSVETKAVLGGDARKYVLDLYRTTPVDVGFLEAAKEAEANGMVYPHKLVLFRTELIDSFYEIQVRNFIQDKSSQLKEYDAELKKAKGKKTANLLKLEKELEFKLKFNPDAFTSVCEGKETDELKKQKNLIRTVSTFLQENIKSFVYEMVQHPNSCALDTNALVRNFHRRGINMRYLGKVATLLDEVDFSVKMFKDLLKEEMIARACKKLLCKIMAESPVFNLQTSISNFLNRLFASDSDSSLGQEIIAQVKSRFLYAIDQETIDRIVSSRFVPLLRSICLKCGIQLKLANYSPTTLFTPQDIVNIVPIVKHAEQKGTFADEILEHARIALRKEGNEATGLQLLSEAIMVYEQTFGRIHAETGRAYAHAAIIYFQLSQMEQAVEFQKKATIVYERTFGVDDPETIQHYMNLGYFEHCAGRTEIGLKLMKHGLRLWNMHCSDGIHPETASALLNISVMYQAKEDYVQEERYLREAISINEQIFGKNHLTTAGGYEFLANNQSCQGDNRAALTSEKIAYQIYKDNFGAEDRRTLMADQALKTLAAKAVSDAKKARELVN